MEPEAAFSTTNFPFLFVLTFAPTNMPFEAWLELEIITSLQFIVPLSNLRAPPLFVINTEPVLSISLFDVIPPLPDTGL